MYFLIQLASCPSNDLQPHPKAKLELWELKPNPKPLKPSPDVSTSKLLTGTISEKQWVIELEYVGDIIELVNYYKNPISFTSYSEMLAQNYFDAYDHSQNNFKIDGAILVNDVDVEK